MTLTTLLTNCGGKPVPCRSHGEAVAHLNKLHGQMLDPIMTKEIVLNQTDYLNKMKVSDLHHVTAGVGFAQKFPTKTKQVAALQNWLLSRKSIFERSGA